MACYFGINLQIDQFNHRQIGHRTLKLTGVICNNINTHMKWANWTNKSSQRILFVVCERTQRKRQLHLYSIASRICPWSYCMWSATSFCIVIVILLNHFKIVNIDCRWTKRRKKWDCYLVESQKKKSKQSERKIGSTTTKDDRWPKFMNFIDEMLIFLHYSMLPIMLIGLRRFEINFKRLKYLTFCEFDNQFQWI